MISTIFHTNSKTKVYAVHTESAVYIEFRNNGWQEVCTIFLPNYKDAKEIAELLKNTLEKEDESI